MIEPHEVQHLIAVLTEQRNRALDTLAETGAKLMVALETIAAKENELQSIRRQLSELLGQHYE